MDFPYTFTGILDRDSVPHTHGESPDYNTFFIRMIGNCGCSAFDLAEKSAKSKWIAYSMKRAVMPVTNGGTIMGRPSKEKALDHKNIITLRLTDIELAYLDQSAESLHITRSEYLRNLILEKPMIYKYEVVADNEQLKKLNGEIGKIGSNLNQIAKHLNQGGVRSMILQDRVHECIDKLFDLRRQVMELAGDYYGDIEAQDK